MVTVEEFFDGNPELTIVMQHEDGVYTKVIAVIGLKMYDKTLYYHEYTKNGLGEVKTFLPTDCVSWQVLATFKYTPPYSTIVSLIHEFEKKI